MINWEAIKEEIDNAKHCVIISHKSPDGDSIGSSLAVSGFLNAIGKKNHVISPDPSPTFLSWLDGFEGLLNYEDSSLECEKIIEDCDLIFCLDFNSLSRIGILRDLIEKKKNPKIINIDHHQEPDHFASYEYLDPKASSTAQLVYEFAENLNWLSLLDKNIAECIYTGILTDTGSFRFSSTSYRTHEIAASLIKIGVDSSKIYSLIYDSYSIDRLKLLGFALSDGLKIYNEYGVAIIALSSDILKSYQFKKGDTEGLVNYPLSIKEINYSILLTEKEGGIRMSFRSKEDYAVNKFAQNYFNGGGHINAAGGISELSLEETQSKLESLLEML